MLPGHEAQVMAMMDEWKNDIRPKVPGSFFELSGHSADDASEMVFVALCRDEPTYRMLAGMPEQDAFFRKLMQHADGDARWEDVQLDITMND
jgi:hypothetical protein